MVVVLSVLPRVACLLALTALTACGGNAVCEKTDPYQASRSTGALQVPEDLTTPSSAGSMKVPEIGSGAEVRGPCADVPPKAVVVASEPAKPPADLAVNAEQIAERAAPTRVASADALPIVIPSITGALETDVRATLEAWLESWRRADLDTYLSFYSDRFTPPVPGESRARWQEKRSLLLGDTGTADIRYDRLTIVETDTGARARFIQEFHNGGEINAVIKVIELVPAQFRWLIVSEEIEAVL